MANYRVGDIIRLARKSIGMSQEELALESGVTPETISRIELGKHKVTQKTYQKIMERLNRFSVRNYAICTGKDAGIIEEKKLLEDTISKFELEKAEKYLEILKEKVEDNPENNQYIMKVEAIINYNNHKISAEDMIKKLEESLRLTVDNYEKYMEYENYKEDGYPYTEQEIITLMNLADAYGYIGMHEKNEKILKMLLECLDSGYIEGSVIKNLKIAIKRNLSVTLESMGRYEEAMDLLNNILQESIKNEYGLMISIALYDITWNMQKLNELSGTELYKMEDIKRKKRQAYYIAAARNDNYTKRIINNSYEKLFHENIMEK